MNIDGIECPVGYECPEGNRIALKCEAGYYCDKPGMARGNKCRPGFFCPEGTKELTDENICIFPFYCPSGSSYQQPCPLGDSPLTDNVNRTDLAENCEKCPEGTYRSNFDQEECFLCEPGYFCPEGTGDYTENVCPQGNACLPGDVNAPSPCEPGTYAFGTGNSICSECLSNTYSQAV